MLKNILAAGLLFTMLATTSVSQTSNSGRSLGPAGSLALTYFQNVRNGDFDAFLRGIRPRRLSADLKAKVIAMVRKQDVISPSAREGRVKLAALEPVLKYHERGSVIDLVVMQADQAGLLFLAGAAVVISEKALGMLTVGELQATVAHELGHEYFWNEYEMARENRQYDKTKELELRCDGLAVITMSGLGLDPSHLISALNKLARSHKGDLVNGDLYPSLEERIAFIRAMIEVVKGKRRGLSRVTSARPRKQSEA